MTAPLAKATLVRLREIRGSGRNAPTRTVPEENGAFEVQFNPTSLRISRQNNIDRGGSTTQTQRRQSPSSQSATLTFDLEFDTAEEFESGGGEQARRPVDVRTKTRIVRQFAEPTRENPRNPPPRVKFIWGTFTFKGIVTQLTEDLDYFSPDGKPLRAKVSVTITEQNDEWEANLVGAAARDARTAAPPGGAGGTGSGPGARPAANPTTTAAAQDGESLQQLLTRLHADPATWRAAMAGLDSPLALAAGTQVQLAAQISAGAGLGMSGGFAAGGDVSATATLAGALGISGGAALSAGVGAGAGEVAAGFALAEGGGLGAAHGAVVTAQAEVSVAQARAAFSLPDVPGRASVATGRPAADPRARSYGQGVPLRARANASTATQSAAGGRLSLTARATDDETTVTTNAALPPWQQLPADGSRVAADARQRRRDAGRSTLRWMY